MYPNANLAILNLLFAHLFNYLHHSTPIISSTLLSSLSLPPLSPLSDPLLLPPPSFNMSPPPSPPLQYSPPFTLSLPFKMSPRARQIIQPQCGLPSLQAPPPPFTPSPPFNISSPFNISPLGKLYNPSVASRHYKAPELLFEYPYYDYAIDVWSAGCMFARCVILTLVIAAPHILYSP